MQLKNPKMVTLCPKTAILVRRMATLLEVVISISLLSLLLFALLSSYAQVKWVDQAIVKQNKRGFSERFLKSRLEGALLQIPSVNKDKTFFFTDHPQFSDSPSLVFTYDNGARTDPLVSGRVLGRLFVDREGHLFLATWPSPERCSTTPVPMRLELLQVGVREISFSFFSPPKKGVVVDMQTLGEEGASIPESNRWHAEWKKGYQSLPPLMRIHLVKEASEAMDFSFYLANNHYPVELL